MLEHPISDLFKISMDSIKEMIDVNTVVGKICKLNDEVSVIPISRVKCSFLTGGLDQKIESIKDNNQYPFGGATGGSVNIVPVAFLVIDGSGTRILHLDDSVHLYEKIIDSAPDVIDKFKSMIFKDENKFDL